MATITTAVELAARARDVAENYKTLYVMGCIGAPLNDHNKARYCGSHAYNADAERTAMINAASADTFGFDCVCLIKSLLWGWNGNVSHIYGGAVYGSNGVPDIGTEQMIAACTAVSTDFGGEIAVGELLWKQGHVGLYLGDGLAVECTPAWANCVQITACNRDKVGYNRRDWAKHGRLPYVSYAAIPAAEPPKPSAGETLYSVKAGDTLWSIARAHGTTYVELAKYNGILNPSRIRVGQIVKIPTAAADDPPTAPAWTPAVGDEVTFTGSTHYVHANALAGISCRPGKAKITGIYRLGSSKHPYQLVAVAGGGSTVCGWVDAGSFARA